MNEETYCCEAAAAEPMAGTSDAVDVWILLEYRPTWRAKALEDNALAEPVRAWLRASVAAFAARGLKARPQFMRQPESDHRGITLLMADRAGCRRLAAETYDDLLTMDLERAGEALVEPHYFVCTNSARDRCCGRFGLPAYAALREHVGERVWQINHVGGHRFAPNVLVLPTGCLYGRVHAGEIGEFVAAVESGRLGARWLRGRSFVAPVVQAAEALSGAERGIADALVAIESISGDRFRVRFDGGRTVDVRLDEGAPSLASCGDAERKIVRSYRLV